MITRSLWNHYRRFVLLCCLALLALTLFFGVAKTYALPAPEPNSNMIIYFYRDGTYTDVVGFINDDTPCGGSYYESGRRTSYSITNYYSCYE